MKDERFEEECLKDKEVIKKAGVKIIADDRTRDVEHFMSKMLRVFISEMDKMIDEKNLE